VPHRGGVTHLDTRVESLESHWFQRWNLKYDKPLSFREFKFNLRLYIEGSINSARISIKVGWCKLKPVLKAPAYSA